MATQFMGVPNADDARLVQQSVIGLFNKPLVDRQFQDASIAGSKLYPSEFGVGAIRYTPTGYSLYSAYSTPSAYASAISFGYRSLAYNAAIAIGAYTLAYDYSVIIGAYSGYTGTVIGQSARSYSTQGVAIGSTAYAIGLGSTALGANSYTLSIDSIAIGRNAATGAVGATAIGTGVYNGVTNSVALGIDGDSITFNSFVPVANTAATAKLPILINGSPYSILLAA